MTVSDITGYLSHLREHYALFVSVHFRAERFSTLPHDVFSALLLYNSHTNRYCMSMRDALRHRKKSMRATRSRALRFATQGSLSIFIPSCSQTR